MGEPDTKRAWFMDQVRQEQSRLRAFISALGVRYEAADDFAQDALLIAFEKLDAFDRSRPEEFGAWVRGIARKLVANAARKDSRRNYLVSEELCRILLEAQAADEHYLVKASSLDHVEVLNSCLQKLPKDNLAIIQMRYFHEYSLGNIASRLNKSAQSVRQGLYRTRRLLLECIERHTAAE